VHALGQVAHFDFPPPLTLPEPLLLHRLSRLLPADLRARAVTVAAPGFDARFSALWRRYEYRISDAATGVDPLRRRYVLGWPRRLDEAAMSAAAAGLVGLHDFAAFCRKREGATTTRTLLRCEVDRFGDELSCTVVADAFCHSMVRSLVGALIAVGEGRRPVDWPIALLTRTERVSEVPVAAAHGLTLVEVGYPPDDQLAARADQTRARRTPR
jgi:tRNA pseudouridine38-40 synthase